MDILVDAHHHIPDNPLNKSIYNTYDIEGIDKINVHSSCNLNIGIHPLFIHKGFNKEKILNILNANRKINIGEVGLDKRGDRNSQLEFFNIFIELAAKFNRTMSIHCVKSWGMMQEAIKEVQVPLLFHGYNGSKEVLKALLKQDSYFSFSIRELNNPRFQEVCSYIPVHRQLVESDMMEDEYLKIGKAMYLKIMASTIEKLSLINSMPLKDFNYIIEDNFNNFTKRRD